MDDQKRKAIQQIMDTGIRNFATGFEARHIADVDNPNGVINCKKNNVFMAELGNEFMFYSAFVRSFDSSFGKALETIGNAMAKYSYQVKGRIDSYLLPQQTQHIDYLMAEYERHTVPNISDYENFDAVQPKNIYSYEKSHEVDNYFFDEIKMEHYIIELKAGGDLDNKKAKAEKAELLKEYFLLKNMLLGKNEEIRIIFATAYNKFGEGNEWKQERVRQYFADGELLIGRSYWNFVCDDNNGFNVIFEQYKESCNTIRKSLEVVKSLYKI